jgi:CRISPR-associated protein Csb3
MSATPATIRINVDVTNPGQFFACCGLLELAARLKPAALSKFEQDEVTHQWRFVIIDALPLAEILERFASAEIRCLDQADNHSAIEIVSPFGLQLDWWRYEKRRSGKLKTWAGQQSAFSILTALRDELKQALPVHDPQNLLGVEAAPTMAVSYFDSPRSANAAARDVGFSLDRLKKGGVIYRNLLHPAVELLCLIGLQRTRPALLPRQLGEEQAYAYHLWLYPIPVCLLPVATNGLLPDRGLAHYRFTNPSRTKDYLAFTPAKPVSAH